MQFMVTTTVRKSEPSEVTGHVYAVDSESWEVTGRTPIPDPMFLKYDTNPRGGPRGGKGMAADGERLWVSNSDHVRCYDSSWRLLQSITHPSCAMIHDVALDGDALWVASTCNDLLLKFDMEGRVADFFDVRRHLHVLARPDLRGLRPWPRAEILAGSVDYRDPRTHALENTDRFHLNAVCRLPDGDLLVSLGRVTSAGMKILWKIKLAALRAGVWRPLMKINRSLSRMLKRGGQRHTEFAAMPGSYRAMVLRWTPGGACRIILDLPGLMVPNHTLLHLDDGSALYNDTDKGEVLIFNPDTGAEISRTFVDRTFLRGAAQVSRECVLVGSQNYLYLVNIAERCVERRLQLCDDPRSAVHGITRAQCRMQPMPERFTFDPALEHWKMVAQGNECPDRNTERQD